MQTCASKNRHSRPARFEVRGVFDFVAVLYGERKRKPLRYLILCRSLTYAQKAAAVLERRGIDAPIIKAPLKLRERGCGYALSVSRRFEEAVALLKEKHLLTGRLYSRTEEGEYREVNEYDLP